MVSHHTQADILSIEALLNCYLREVALPNQWLSFIPTPRSGYRAELTLTAQACSLYFYVHSVSATANYHYLRLPSQSPTGPELDPDRLAVLLLTELCHLEDQDDCVELLEQIRCSRTVMTRILEHKSHARPLPNGVVDAFVESERAMTVGHRYHPTPKARQGMSEQELFDFSPEHDARFQWRCFSIPREWYRSRGDVDLQTFIRTQWMPELDLDEDRALLPVHPWQARFLAEQDEIRDWLRTGALLDHGSAGQKLYATSSLRSCYHPDLDYFVKGSLNVRLTNCVRKNAIYELDTAVALSDAIRPLAEPMRDQGFTLMYEPAYQSLDSDRGIARDWVEGFSFIARENRFRDEQLGHRPVMAGALFAPQPGGESLIRAEIAAAGGVLKTGYFNAALLWFNALLDVMVEPTMRLYFEHGVVLEPHLQNGLIGLKRHLPVHYYYRDMEGTKLVPEQWPAALLPELSEQALSSVYYDADKGWNRVCYCLFLNTLAQAVFYIGGGDELLERSLWRAVADYLDELSVRLPAGRERLQALLSSAYLPNKANLLVRFRKQADRQAGYVMTANPIRRAHTDTRPVRPQEPLDAAV
ncbi:IucA/IucC family protein [Saccharospirillum salsuginis]|uniref:Aconitase n=1 Tax=Saccharospirillum salsuginis TaxID=418750 RepID=A0A918N6M2_9GAMM|nr:IucA/IucC family protein [Saccharospirillum salsuginis]GGX40238.1 aconitase [Saccharospirillum salsuginis]